MFCKSLRKLISSVIALFISCFCDSDGKASRRSRIPSKKPLASNLAGFVDLAIMMKPLKEDLGDFLVLLCLGRPSGGRTAASPDRPPLFRSLAVTHQFRGVDREAFTIERA